MKNTVNMINIKRIISSTRPEGRRASRDLNSTKKFYDYNCCPNWCKRHDLRDNDIICVKTHQKSPFCRLRMVAYFYTAAVYCSAKQKNPEIIRKINPARLKP